MIESLKRGIIVRIYVKYKSYVVQATAISFHCNDCAINISGAQFLCSDNQQFVISTL